MGSRVMHYCISTLLAQELGIDDDQFLLGGIAPDVHKYMNAPKKDSHFIILQTESEFACDYRGFCQKYEHHMKDPFFLGYFYHLISDDIWVKEIYYKKIKWLPQPEKKEAQGKYYRDFWRLNGKLIDRYALTLKPLDAEAVRMDEIDYTYLPELIRDLKSDFAMKDEAKDEALEILRFDEVIEVLESSVKACLDESNV
ncbi:hypothetical protein RJP21_13900 [Paenibacillus sp. VCA1]|uniref:hypothetical protein n=1 Tax=Paenibacillus sp. VCA1 TaxID=3039148 RepID=UPI0028729DCC|nr:hypothetical protein [Paenibacillus sp. VCA1]MDR9854704.1 hypothetical protein [Paenibacillus sp. VCA1]